MGCNVKQTSRNQLLYCVLRVAGQGEGRQGSKVKRHALPVPAQGGLNNLFAHHPSGPRHRLKDHAHHPHYRVPPGPAQNTTFTCISTQPSSL